MADLFTKIEKIFHFGYQCPEIKSHFGLVLTNSANQVALTSVYAHVGAISPGEFRSDVRKLELIKDSDTMEPAYIVSFTRDEGRLRQGWRPEGSIPVNPPRREGEARDRSRSASRSTHGGRSRSSSHASRSSDVSSHHRRGRPRARSTSRDPCAYWPGPADLVVLEDIFGRACPCIVVPHETTPASKFLGEIFEPGSRPARSPRHQGRRPQSPRCKRRSIYASCGQPRLG